MLTVKVLGGGCPNCKRLEQHVRQAGAELGLEMEVVKVTDIQDIMAYNVLTTPGLVINENLVSSGRVSSPAEIKEWLAEAAG
jgi:small redox-active disulfide protein 2